MTPDRWTLALQNGALSLPEGRVLVLGARAGADLTGLGDVHAVTSFFPDHAALRTAGHVVGTEPEGSYEAALVQISKSKPASLARLRDALLSVPPGAPVLVDGQKTEGIESILKAVRSVLPVGDVLSKSHGKLFWLTRPEILPDGIDGWALEPIALEGGYTTLPGMFSADGPDPGSELLVALVPQMKGRVADLGAGWGYLAGEILAEQDKITGMDLIEADWTALAAARMAVTDDRADFIWADATTFATDAPYDAVISNPPFHSGRDADPKLGQAFIATAARILKPSGRFYMVANRHLPYEAALKAAFATGRMLAEMNGYKLYEAAKPKRGRG